MNDLKNTKILFLWALLPIVTFLLAILIQKWFIVGTFEKTSLILYLSITLIFCIIGSRLSENSSIPDSLCSFILFITVLAFIIVYNDEKDEFCTFIVENSIFPWIIIGGFIISEVALLVGVFKYLSNFFHKCSFNPVGKWFKVDSTDYIIINEDGTLIKSVGENIKVYNCLINNDNSLTVYDENNNVFIISLDINKYSIASIAIDGDTYTQSGKSIKYLETKEKIIEKLGLNKSYSTALACSTTLPFTIFLMILADKAKSIPLWFIIVAIVDIIWIAGIIYVILRRNKTKKLFQKYFDEAYENLGAESIINFLKAARKDKTLTLEEWIDDNRIDESK